MNYLYLLLNLGSLSVPFLFSFHPKLKFYTHWKGLALGILAGMLLFIPWDVFFTINQYWGFNPTYYLGKTILGLPVEEWLFFICIPYACVFTHYALLYYFPNLKLKNKTTKLVSYLLIFLFFVVAIYNTDKWYTLINFGVATILTCVVITKSSEILQSYLLTFLVMLIPFFIVNGILTGSFIPNEVVWYNDSENLGIRMFTIPVEDSIYAFSLILLNLYIIKIFENRKTN
ncbi:lycopene cyclase domain-containing protein [Aestuariibaculum suncheonense]|uniref:Lycopene cyclase domain-containing protein n=1 Tax=Aestuariibaculum suncheonense TaxID=1028745 RepID=A0A8J6QCR6_9FLAO|nr:lycopene cyclase domain-containing protein [Aestuariibaculum suncheonense]MBD0834933.1 lycopene cyclase domain-containing protein [Aestuariibaculum suncheonense]